MKECSDRESEIEVLKATVLEIMKIMFKFFRPPGSVLTVPGKFACAFECRRHVPAAGAGKAYLSRFWSR